MKFTVNIDIKNVDRVDISDSKLMEIKNDSVLIVLSTESNNRLYEYYANIRGLLIRGNRVILLIDKDNSKIKKQICMLLVTYQNYDIYNIENMSNVDKEYTEQLESRTVSYEEIETFIGSDIAIYDKINEFLAKMTDLIRSDKFGELTTMLVENINALEETMNVVDYLKNVADTSNMGFQNTVTKLKEELEAKEQSMQESSILIQSKEFSLNQLKTEIEDYKKDIAKYRDELEKVGNGGNALILSYSTVNLNITKSRTSAVLYFKEISKLRYINTFVISLMTILQKMNKLDVKLLIYDSNVNFNVYKPLSYVDSRTYNEKKDIFLDKTKNDKMVITEPASNILSDIIRFGYDVVIVYDRLRGTDDLITGAQVYKYYVVSSKHEYDMLRMADKNIPDEEIIGHPYINPNIIGLSEIAREEVANTESTKIKSYFNLRNTGTKKEIIVKSILEKINADKIKK